MVHAYSAHWLVVYHIYIQGEAVMKIPSPCEMSVLKMDRSMEQKALVIIFVL